MNKSDLKQITPFEAQSYLIEELCHSHFKGDGSELDKRINNVWKSLRGTTYRNRDSVSFSLVGGPQTAKTFCFRNAAKAFSQAVGLDFVENPDDKTIVKLNNTDSLKNSFIYISHEYAGEMSALTTGGLPSKKELNDTEYMTNLPLMKFAALEQAGGGLLLLDDLANAAPNVRNALLPLLQFKRAGSLNLEGKFVGSTRNRGSLDGTHTSKTSSAEVTRGAQYELNTSLGSWLEHILPQYEGTSTQMIIETFMLNHGHEHFYRPTNKTGDAPWPGARTWDNCLKQINTEILDSEELLSIGRRVDGNLKRIDDRAGSMVGIETGQVFTAHARTWLKGALPCAIEQMKNGELSSKLRNLLNDYIVEKCNTPEGSDFATNYAYALANECASKIVNLLDSGKKIRNDKALFVKQLQNFVNGVYNYGLHEDKMSLAMTKFKDILVETSQTKHKIGRLNDDGMTVVNDEFLKLMTEVVGTNQIARMPHPDIADVKLYDMTFTEVFSNSSKMESDFERVSVRQTASEFRESIENLKELAEETPSFSELNAGTPKNSDPVDIEKRVETVADDFAAETNESATTSQEDELNEIESSLDDILGKDNVDDFSLNQEVDGEAPETKSEKKASAEGGDFDDIDLDFFDEVLEEVSKPG